MKLKGRIIDVNIDYISHKPKITLELAKQGDILTEEFNSLQELDTIDIELKKEVKIRGLQANKYFHSLLNELGSYWRSKLVAISDDELKIRINLSYGTVARDSNGMVRAAKVPKGEDLSSFYPYCKKYRTEDNLDCYIFYKRTSELNTLEFTQLIRGLEAECQEVGIETLQEKEFRKMMEQYDKEFERRNSEPRNGSKTNQ